MKISQATRILKVLDDSRGEWINGRYFNDTMKISQYHARIHTLQKEGWKITPSEFKDEFGFKSYKLELEEGKPPYKNPPTTFNKEDKLETLTPKPLKPYYEYN